MNLRSVRKKHSQALPWPATFGPAGHWPNRAARSRKKTVLKLTQIDMKLTRFDEFLTGTALLPARAKVMPITFAACWRRLARNHQRAHQSTSPAKRRSPLTLDCWRFVARENELRISFSVPFPPVFLKFF
jgi:hypothetical protein